MLTYAFRSVLRSVTWRKNIFTLLTSLTKQRKRDGTSRNKVEFCVLPHAYGLFTLAKILVEAA